MSDTFEPLYAISKWAKPAVGIMRAHMNEDAAHDESHLYRVATRALRYGRGGNEDALIVAGLLHDLVNVPKDHPDRSRASLLSADEAFRQLAALKMPFWLCSVIHHAIHAHSYSANILPTTMIACAIQDADRIEALGALGIARLFAVSGSMGRSLFHAEDPLAMERDLDETKYAIDHIAVKLGSLHKTMKTEFGRRDALHLTGKMVEFLVNLLTEIDPIKFPFRGTTDSQVWDFFENRVNESG